MSERWKRRKFIAKIVVGILTCTVPLGLYFYDNREQEIGTPVTESSESSESSDDSLPTVSISSIYVSDVAMDVPAVFEIAVEVGGVSNQPARKLNVILDFGRAEVQVCDFTPKQAIRKFIEDDKSYRRLEIEELRQGETLYIRCLISSPEFKRVVVEGTGIFRGISIDFAEYQANLFDEPIGFWSKLFRVFIAFLVAMLCLRIFLLVFR